MWRVHAQMRNKVCKQPGGQKAKRSRLCTVRKTPEGELVLGTSDGTYKSSCRKAHVGCSEQQARHALAYCISYVDVVCMYVFCILYVLYNVLCSVF